MRVIALVAILLLGGCQNSSSWDDGRFQLATTGEKQSVFLLDTRTGRVWEKMAGYQQDFVPIAIMKDSSSLARIGEENSRLLSYKPYSSFISEKADWLLGIKK